MGKELTRFEVAVVKRTAQSTKPLRNKRDRIIAKIEALRVELEEVKAVIEKFEAPIREITGGLTSEEVLTQMATEVAATTDETANDVDDTATTDEVEVPVEDAVEISEGVESPLEDRTPNEDNVMIGE